MSAFQPKSDFVRILSERGFIHQVTDIERLDVRVSSGRITAYIGFDATANSLHVGNLVQIMMLRWLQKTGHRPLCVMGGGTTKVGDPSGKDATRPLTTETQIAENLAGIKRAFDAYLTFGDGPSDAQFVNNAEWLEGFGYIEFLRAFGPHFTINRMLTFDSVKLRLEREQPLTFIEFNYMLMQAVDFLELHQRYGCSLQMGGSDQWGNIVNGVELVRRKAEGEAFGLTTPLLTTASGAKMGKTAAGAVWLNADRLSVYDYWQFWRNADDADVERFLKLYTDMPLDEIARLSALQGAEINEAKKILADAATTLLHGPEAALSARQAAQTAFEQGGVSADMPSYDLPRAELQHGLQLATLIRDAGLAASSSDARRLASGGGLRVNDVSEPDAARLLTLQDVTESGVIKIAAGKKKIVIVNVV